MPSSLLIVVLWISIYTYCQSRHIVGVEFFFLVGGGYFREKFLFLKDNILGEKCNGRSTNQSRRLKCILSAPSSTSSTRGKLHHLPSPIVTALCIVYYTTIIPLIALLNKILFEINGIISNNIIGLLKIISDKWDKQTATSY